MEWNESESGREVSGRNEEDAAVAALEARGADGRFRKGASGNPTGRRGWRKRSGRPGDRLVGADEPTRELILTEAYRTVRLRNDGSIADDGEEEMPANQAILRAMMRAALSGNRLAQHRWTQLVREAEREQRAAQVVIYNAMERADYRRNPKASYDDDIILDTTVGTVLVREGDESRG
jgi:hypothetical protein